MWPLVAGLPKESSFLVQASCKGNEGPNCNFLGRPNRLGVHAGAIPRSASLLAPSGAASDAPGAQGHVLRKVLN